MQTLTKHLLILILFGLVQALHADGHSCGQTLAVHQQTTKRRISPAVALNAAITIDYVAFYTPAAAAAEGGRDQLLATLSAAFTGANERFQNSGLNITHNLLAAFELPINNSTNDLATIYSELAGLPIYTEKMNELQADTSMTIVEFQLPGGYANIPLNTRQAKLGGSMWFGLPNVSGGILAHEIGHTLGGMHDYVEGNQLAPQPATFYPRDISYGNHFIGQGTGLCYRTIMSAILACRVAGFENQNAVRVDLFSGSNLLYDGTPTGTANQADNVRVFEYYAPFVGSARGPSQIPPDSGDGGGGGDGDNGGGDDNNPDDPNDYQFTLNYKVKNDQLILKGKCRDNNEQPLDSLFSIQLFKISRAGEKLIGTTNCNAKGLYKLKTKKKARRVEARMLDLDLISEQVRITRSR